jgi:hypothetical protein
LKTIKTATLLWTLIAGLSAAPVLYAQADPVAKSPSSAIEVEMIEPGEIDLPSEFQVALYENLVQQLQKEGGFSQVYRDGERDAIDAPDLVILHTATSVQFCTLSRLPFGGTETRECRFNRSRIPGKEGPD